MRTLVAIGAHMDDAYYGAGPILLSAAREGNRVVIVTVVSDFSTWQRTVGREAQTREDLCALAEKWGCEQRFLDYPYHRVEPDTELKEKIAEILQEVQADVVFVHNTHDHWPDHRAAGIAAKDAAVFRHGLTGNLEAPRTPLVMAFNLTPSQTIRFEPDTFIDVTDEMPDFMAMLAGADRCLWNLSDDEVWVREVNVLNEDARGGPPTLRASRHGWIRLTECATWGARCGVSYALALKTLWSWRSDNDAVDWFRRTWPDLRPSPRADS